MPTRVDLATWMRATDVGSEAVDIYLVIEPDFEPAEFLGESVTFEGVLTDVCNRQASSSVEVVLSCLPDDTYCAGR